MNHVGNSLSGVVRRERVSRSSVFIDRLANQKHWFHPEFSRSINDSLESLEWQVYKETIVRILIDMWSWTIFHWSLDDRHNRLVVYSNSTVLDQLTLPIISLPSKRSFSFTSDRLRKMQSNLSQPKVGCMIRSMVNLWKHLEWSRNEEKGNNRPSVRIDYIHQRRKKETDKSDLNIASLTWDYWWYWKCNSTQSHDDTHTLTLKTTDISE